MIERFYTTEFSIKRPVWTTEVVDGTVIDKSSEQVVDNFMGYRQQSSSEYAESRGLSLSKPHIIWCPLETNVSEGDVLVSTIGVDKVRAKQINNTGNNQHLELLVEFVGEEQESS